MRSTRHLVLVVGSKQKPDINRPDRRTQPGACVIKAWLLGRLCDGATFALLDPNAIVSPAGLA